MQHMAVVRSFTIPASGGVHDGDSVTVTPTNRTPTAASAGGEIPMMSLALTVPQNEWDAQSVALGRFGTLADSDVTARVYLDATNNGSVDAGDTLLGSSGFSSGAATVTLSPAPRAVPGTPVNLLVTAALGSAAPAGSTVQMRLAPNGIVHSSTGGQ